MGEYSGRKSIIFALAFLLLTSLIGTKVLNVRAPPYGASLTGQIYDEGGVDTDGDGAYNYLKVGVEVNVTKGGEYQVSLSGLRDSQSNYINLYYYKTEHLDSGIHNVSLSLYGPSIYDSHKNPENISSIYLYEIEYSEISYWSRWLDSESNLALSREYQYTEFDSPFLDSQVKFVVYPDERIEISGDVEYTDIPQRNMIGRVQATERLTTSGNSTLASANYTWIPPPEATSIYPFNATQLTLEGDYSQNLLDAEIDFTLTLPPKVAAKFPYNITDFTLLGEYSDKTISGTAIFYALPDSPVAAMNVNYLADRTAISVNGSGTVIYGTYSFDSYQYTVNATYLDEQLNWFETTYPGRGPGSIYSMTHGLLECTTANALKTPIEGGATVDLEMEITGDLLKYLAYLFSGGYEPTYSTYFSILDAIYNSVQDLTLEATYAKEQKKVSMTVTFTANMRSIWDDLSTIVPGAYPLETRSFFESLLNETYCSVKSAHIYAKYQDGKADYKETATIEGDVNAQVNQAKNTYLEYWNATYYQSYPAPIPWQFAYAEDTELDITSLYYTFDMDESYYTTHFEGLTLSVPVDTVDATSFQLWRFFNSTEDIEFPEERQRLKVTVQGGSNYSHFVVPSRPATVPAPDITDLDNKLITWNNQTLINLKDLIFNIEEDPSAIVSVISQPELVSSDNPFIMDATENAATVFEITAISNPVTLVIRNITQPEDVGPPPSTFKLLGNYVEILSNETDINVTATIRMYYTMEQLQTSELDESTLKIHFWNATSKEWVPVESHVDAENHFVWANVDHFSLWAIMGQLPALAWPQFLIIAGIAVAVIAIVTVIIIMRKRKPLHPAPESAQTK